MNTRSLLLALPLLACAQTVNDAPGPAPEPSASEGPSPLVCVPGEPVYCRCDDGAAGAATCLEHGRRGPCRCDLDTTPRPSVHGELPLPPAIDPSAACPAARDGCYVEPATQPLCPCARVRSDPARPAWRITSMRIVAPVPLAAGFMGEVLTRAIQSGQLQFGIDADLANRSVRFGRLDRRQLQRGDVGLGLLDARFRFFAGNADAAAPSRFDPARAEISLEHGAFSTVRGLGAVDLPVQLPDRTEVLDVPLCDLRLRRVPLADDLGCIGRALPVDGAFNECRAAWDPTDGGELTAAITVTQAQAIPVDAAGRTLCALLAGAGCEGPARTWAVRPDTFACGDAAWTVTARFTAVSATIAR